MADPTFWDDSEQAQKVINENNANKETYDQFNQLAEEFEELEVLLEMIQEEPDAEMEAELAERIQALNEKMGTYEQSMLLDEPYDRNNAIIELHPGAGGTESQDWGSMLLRMYTRFCEQHGYQVETLDYQAGDEAGIKSVTLLIKGHNAYGYLKSEKGVHRLVRISPFDSAKRRHTSFCSVDVMPELDGAIDIEINSDDLKIDTYRASGAGGQHINKTESAVRITHIPTGTVVASTTFAVEKPGTSNGNVESKTLSTRSRKERTGSCSASRRTDGDRLGFTNSFLCLSSVFHGQRSPD